MTYELTANPFKFGNPVEGDYYLPRLELSTTICKFLENRIHIVLVGPRRFGKASFSLNLLNDFEKEGWSCLYIDIFNITSHRDFLQQFVRAIRLKKSFNGTLKLWWERIKRLTPKVSVDIDPIMSHLAQLADEDTKSAIQDPLENLSSLGNKVIVILDEFQKISEIDDNGWLEATLRSHFQILRNVSFLFTGLRKSLISEMLNNPSRPLYRSCQTMEFPTFGEEFTDWVIERFSTVGIQCEKNAIEHLRELVQDTPNYVQNSLFSISFSNSLFYRNQRG